MKAWEKYSARFEALQPRERVMVFAAGAAIILGLAFALVIDRAMTRQKTFNTTLERHRGELAQLQSRNVELTRLMKQDPDAPERKRIEDLQHALSGYDSELRGVREGLVPPKLMVKVLEEMLNRDARVRLVKLRTLPVASLVEAADKSADAAPAKDAKNLVYKHGIELTVEGNYLDLLDYQTRLEKLPWRMFFARTSINSADYPRVYMTITLYTLSLEEAWLVV